MTLGWIAAQNRDHTVTVRVTPLPLFLLRTLLEIAAMMTPFVAFALVAAWRTWVHARRYVEGRSTGWQGVAESGAAGFFVALLVLSRGIVTHPAQAPPYVIFYGGTALILGVALGCVLRFAAILTLKLSR